MTDLFALDPKHAEESENLASLSSGALQQKLHEVNELQRQSEYLLARDSSITVCCV